MFKISEDFNHRTYPEKAKEVARFVCWRYGIGLDQMSSSKRFSLEIEARRVFIYICTHFNIHLSIMADVLGKDRTTMYKHFGYIDDNMEDPVFEENLNYLLELISNNGNKSI